MPTRILRNNIIDGGGDNSANISNISNNIYISTAWRQNINYSWSLGSEERLVLDKNQLFANYLNNDFRLKTGSPAVNNGADLSSQGLFDDLLLTSRYQEGKFDIGAYEYVP